MQNFFEATVELVGVTARASGHDSPSGFERRDLTAWGRTIADLTAVEDPVSAANTDTLTRVWNS